MQRNSHNLIQFQDELLNAHKYIITKSIIHVNNLVLKNNMRTHLIKMFFLSICQKLR